MGKIEKIAVGLCKLVEIGSIIGLAAIGLKRNHDCYNAECENIKLRCDALKKDVDMVYKDAEIRVLKREIETLKNKCEFNEEEEA